MRAALAIANADAGSSTDEARDAALEVLRTRLDVELATTSSPDELENVLAGHPDVDLVVALGGDGSLHAVVAALYDAGRLADVTLALVPLGTGNDFARSLDLPLEPEDAAQVILGGRVVELDLMVDGTDSVVVNAAHVGIGAEAAAKAEPWKKRLGPVGYAIGAMITGFTKKGAAVEIFLDGEPMPAQERVLQVAVGNGRFVGGGAELLPKADPTDGLIDVAVSYAVGFWRRLTYGWYLRRGKHPEHDDVIYRRAKTVEVHGERMRCTSDGEVTPPEREHSWRIEPGALRFVVP
jgi:YegS/Rv2252/BmrU family lipid kinase